MAEQGSIDRRRGGGFPSLSLRDAVDAVVVAGLNGPDHTVDAFAAYLGHSTANSGAFRAKLASLRDWGLLARGDKDRVTLSDLAQELVLEYPEHYDAKRLLLTAFESCRPFGMLYGDSAKNTPLETSRLRTTLLMRYGVATNQVDKFIESFATSAVFAGLARSDGTTVTLLGRQAAFESTDGTDATTETVETVPATNTAGPADAGTSPPPASQTPVALRQQWPIDGGEIEFVIRTSKALPPSIYRLVAEAAEVAEKMKVQLTSDEPFTVDPDLESLG